MKREIARQCAIIKKNACVVILRIASSTCTIAAYMVTSVIVARKSGNLYG